MHFRSKALERTILKICVRVNVKSNVRAEGNTHFLHIDAVTRAAEDQACLHCSCKAFGLVVVSLLAFMSELRGAHLIGDFLLLFAREVDEVIVFCAN